MFTKINISAHIHVDIRWIQHVYINTLLRADLMRRKRMCQYVDASECDGFHKLYCVYRVGIRVKY